MMATGQVVANSGGGKKRRRNQVGDFFADMIHGGILRSFVAEHGLAEVLGQTEKTTNEQLAVALILHFRDHVPQEEQVRCDACEAISGADLSRCPVCGDGSPVEAAADESEDAPLSERELPSQVDVGDEESGPIEDPDAEEAVAAAPEPKKTKKVKDKQMQVQQANGATTKALAKAGSTAMRSVKALDKAVQEIYRLKSEGAENYWRMGQKLFEVNAEELWKLRVDEGGKGAYKTFDAFVHAELKMSSTHAYNAIDVAKEYKSPDEVRALGNTKAALILKAAPMDRKDLKEKARAGATRKELERDVKESRSKHGSPKAGKRGSKAGAASAATKKAEKAEKAPGDKITVASIEGSRSIKLFKRPETMKGLDMSKLKRARTVGDQPFGRHDLANGVVQYFSVVHKDDGLYLKVETRREA